MVLYIDDFRSKNKMVTYQLRHTFENEAVGLPRNIQIFTTRVIVIQHIYGTTYEYIHTNIHAYIHTDSAFVQHVNVGLAQAQANYDCMYV